MSQYLNLFLRGKEDSYNGKILPLDQFSRSSTMYQLFDDGTIVHFEVVKRLDLNTIDRLISNTKDQVEACKSHIEHFKKIIDILKPGAYYEDYYREVTDTLDNIDEIKESIIDFEAALNYLIFLKNIIENNQCEILFGIEAWFDDDGKLKEEE